MNYLNLLGGNLTDKRASAGLFLLRLVFGAALVLHGLPKAATPFTWMHSAAVPGFLQALSVLSEVGGGLALILGLLTPLACLGIICNMTVAIVMVHIAHGDPWIGHGRSFESALGYLVAAATLLLTGPGVFALDTLLRRSTTSKPQPAPVYTLPVR